MAEGYPDPLTYEIMLLTPADGAVGLGNATSDSFFDAVSPKLGNKVVTVWIEG